MAATTISGIIEAAKTQPFDLQGRWIAELAITWARHLLRGERHAT